MADRQNIEPGDRKTISALLRRIEAARRFPDNTDPSARHVQIMGETLGTGLPYPMLDEERGHCAISLLAVVAALYEARNAASSPSVSDGGGTPLSDFIRNATPEQKAEVYERVMDKVADRQQAVIDAAGVTRSEHQVSLRSDVDGQ